MAYQGQQDPQISMTRGLVAPCGPPQDPYLNQNYSQMMPSQPAGGPPAFSNSMRIDATGALIPNGLTRDMMGTSTRSTISSNQFAMMANSQHGQAPIGNTFPMTNNNNFNNDFSMMTNSQHHGQPVLPAGAGVSNFGVGNSLHQHDGQIPAGMHVSTQSRNYRERRNSSSGCSTISSGGASFGEDSSPEHSQKTEDEQQIREEYEKELLRKEREAKMLRFEQRVSSRKLQCLEENQEETKSKLKKAKKKSKQLEEEAKNTIAQIAAEKEGVTNELEELEEENEDMMIRIAELEEESLMNKEKEKKKKKKRSKSAERKLMSEMCDLDEGRPTIRRSSSIKGPLMVRGMEPTTSNKKRSKSAERQLHMIDDGDDDTAVYRKGRSLDRSRHSDSDYSDSSSYTKKKKKKKRPKSAERELAGSDDDDDDSVIYDKSLERNRHSDGDKKKKRSKSFERKLRIDDDDTAAYDRSLDRSSRHSDNSKRKQRSKSTERKLNTEACDVFERPNMRVTRSSDDQLLALQKHARRNNARGEELHVDRRMMIRRATSERVLRSSNHKKKPSKLARLREEQEEERDVPVRGLSRSKSFERRNNGKRSSSADRLKPPKRSHSGEKLIRVNRYH
jgi:hypothetical protein